MQLILHTPSELVASESIYIRSVEAQLESCVEAKVGLVTKTATETRSGWNLQGLFPVNREHFEVDLGTWGQYLVMDALPTCKSRKREDSGMSNTLQGLHIAEEA
ncbi:hypothetical protein Forpi1262_v008345 [Fusarium oxysporum f. sp. raphani]|uniref:Uncharacterized protein n=1 Tax=Fusarium oxysporum f. sp. raphani TaxID=96318 RepID=A0A8J5ULX8_FUSOX|nr:hypothetical protein Forpi1262_v008345 [Fusarium oxysporum f. sp. raphani]